MVFLEFSYLRWKFLYSMILRVIFVVLLYSPSRSTGLGRGNILETISSLRLFLLLLLLHFCPFPELQFLRKDINHLCFSCLLDEMSCPRFLGQMLVCSWILFPQLLSHVFNFQTLRSFCYIWGSMYLLLCVCRFIHIPAVLLVGTYEYDVKCYCSAKIFTQKH